MTKTYWQYPWYYSIPMSDIREFNLINEIDPKKAFISTRTVHLEALEFNRIRAILTARGHEINVKLSETNSHGHQRQSSMPYDPGLVLQPLDHGDFVFLKNDIITKRYKEKIGGSIGIIQRTKTSLVAKGIGWSTHNISSLIQGRISKENIPEATRERLEKSTSPVIEKVRVQVEVFCDKQNPDLMNYLLKRRAAAYDIGLHDNRPVRQFIFEATPRSAKLFVKRCFGGNYGRRRMNIQKGRIMFSNIHSIKTENI